MKKILLLFVALFAMQIGYGQKQFHYKTRQVIQYPKTTMDGKELRPDILAALLQTFEYESEPEIRVKHTRKGYGKGGNVTKIMVHNPDGGYFAIKDIFLGVNMHNDMKFVVDENSNISASDAEDICRTQLFQLRQIYYAIINNAWYVEQEFKVYEKDDLVITEEDCNCPEKEEPKVYKKISNNDGSIIGNSNVAQGRGDKRSYQIYSRELEQDLNQPYVKTVRQRNPLNTGRAWFGAIHVRENQGWLIDVPSVILLAGLFDLATGNGIDGFGLIGDKPGLFSNERWGPNDSGEQNSAFIFKGISIQPQTGYDQQSKTFIFGLGMRL